MTTSSYEALNDELPAIAGRYGLSLAATEHLFSALVAGGGYQAQFNHPELGGMGQWSQGGMLMIGDMFNHHLKSKVASLCSDLAEIAMRERDSLRQPASSQSQYQGSGSQQPDFRTALSNWYPDELGTPSATGAQNDMRYAVFPATRRLAISVGGKVTVYDTKDHMIGGFSQQQSGDQSIGFTSQHGRIDLTHLEQVSDGGAVEHAGRNAETTPSPSSPTVHATRTVEPQSFSDDDIIGKIERLAALHSKGILSDEEFTGKKKELLARL